MHVGAGRYVMGQGEEWEWGAVVDFPGTFCAMNLQTKEPHRVRWTIVGSSHLFFDCTSLVLGSNPQIPEK